MGFTLYPPTVAHLMKMLMCSIFHIHHFPSLFSLDILSRFVADCASLASWTLTELSSLSRMGGFTNLKGERLKGEPWKPFVLFSCVLVAQVQRSRSEIAEDGAGKQIYSYVQSSGSMVMQHAHPCVGVCVRE